MLSFLSQLPTLVWAFILQVLQSEVAAAWAVAIGTFALAVTTFWLARDAQRIKFRGHCLVRKEERLSEKYGYIIEDRLILVIDNYGGKQITIHDIEIKVGEDFVKATFNEVWLEEFTRYRLRPGDTAKTLPVTIDAGAECVWEFSLTAVAEDIVEVKFAVCLEPFRTKELIRSEKDAKKLRFVIRSNRGRSKSIRPHKLVVNAIIKAFNDKSSKREKQ